MDNTGAIVPNVSIQASGRGSSVDIWITYRDGRRHNTKNFWKLSRLRFFHVENVSQATGVTYLQYGEGLLPNPKHDQVPKRNYILWNCLPR